MKKPPPLSPSPPGWDQLEQVHELNRLFLTYLQMRACDDRDCLGLPDCARPILRKTCAEAIAVIAEFPRALFDLKLEEHAGRLRDPLASRDDAARHSLSLTLLLCARSLCRQSAYQGRLLLGLEPRAIQRLRALQLNDLQQLAHDPQLILCAFAGRDWLWNGLLTDARPEARRQLALVALQPGLARDWPARRVSRLPS